MQDIVSSQSNTTSESNEKSEDSVEESSVADQGLRKRKTVHDTPVEQRIPPIQRPTRARIGVLILSTILCCLVLYALYYI